VWAAARAIRVYLPDLIGATDAQQMDNALGGILNADPAAPDGSQRLRVLLESTEATAAFLDGVLADPPQFRPLRVRTGALRGRYTGPPGNPDPPFPDRYVCPVNGDDVWYRDPPNASIRTCSTHGCMLVRG
jgi:hypothetical protein